jgi:hypothetical protein
LGFVSTNCRQKYTAEPVQFGTLVQENAPEREALKIKLFAVCVCNGFFEISGESQTRGRRSRCQSDLCQRGPHRLDVLAHFIFRAWCWIGSHYIQTVS